MRKILLFAMIALLFVACEDDLNTDDDPQITTEEPDNYFPMSIGNYWIYQEYEMDINGLVTETQHIDSTIITRDTVINNYTYFVLEGIQYPYSNWRELAILRDSSGYLVNPDGRIDFATENFSDTLYTYVQYENIELQTDTIYSAFAMMEKPADSITVPAGTFDALNCRIMYTSPSGVFGDNDPRSNYTSFGNHVGKIISTYFYANSSLIYEKRLIRYHINQE